MTMKQFVIRHGIKITSEYVDRNPLNPEWSDANHYKVTLRCGRRQMTTYFSMGYGLSGEPTAADVLDCLASDSADVDNNSFDDWCAEYGYDTDSRKAEKIYRTCQNQAAKLAKFLGDRDYGVLLYDVERG